MKTGLETMQDVVWLRAYSEVYEAFMTPQLVQASYDSSPGAVFEGVLATLEGELHTYRRRIEQPLFSPSNVQIIDKAFAPKITQEEFALAAETGRGDLLQIARRCTVRLAARIVGLDGADGEDREALEELVAYMVRFAEAATVGWSTRPRESVLSGISEVRQSYRESFWEPSLERRRASASLPHSDTAQTMGKRSVDLLTILAEHEDESDWHDGRILETETIHYLIASGHSASATAVHAFDDLRLFWERHPERQSEAIDPSFIRRAVTETLRFHAPTSFMFRYAVEPVALVSGRSIDAGSYVGLDLVAANRDVQAFGSDAGEFNPYRDIPSKMQPFGLSFGSGAHMCPGRRIAAGGGQLEPQLGGDDDNRMASAKGIVGIVSHILAAAIEAGAEMDLTKAPEKDPGTQRDLYLNYPIVFAD